MENRYDIRFGEQEPSPEAVAGHRDFDALLARLAEQPSVSTESSTTTITPQPAAVRRRLLPRYLTAAAAAAILLSIGLAILFNNGTAGPSAAERTAFLRSSPYIDPPREQYKPAYQNLALTVVDRPGDQWLALSDRATLVYSSTTFMTDRGRSAENPITVYYREMADFADFFLAGVPLEYDERDQHYHLATNSLVDFYAEDAAGNRLVINEDEPLQVVFKGTVQTAADGSPLPLSVYHLDSTARRWDHAGEDDIRLLDQPNGSSAAGPRAVAEENYGRRLAELEQSSPLPPAPIAPVRSTGNNPTLELDFINSLSLAPGSDLQPAELERLNESGIWEIIPEGPAIDQRAFSVIWEQVRLRRRGEGKFELTLINPQRSESLVVRPVLLGDAFSRAESDFTARRAEYDRAVAQRETTMAPRRRQIRADYEAELAAINNAQDHHHGPATSLVSAEHRFTAGRFGLYALARPLQPTLLDIEVRLTSADNWQIEGNQKAYLADPVNRTLVRQVAAPRTTLTVDSSRPAARLWLVDEAGNLRSADLPVASPGNKKRTEVAVKNAGKLPAAVQ